MGVTTGTFARSLASQGKVDEITDLFELNKTNPTAWNAVISELYERGDVESATAFFRDAHQRGQLPVWHPREENTLDLHRLPSAVACCAVRHFLLNATEDRPLGIVVGRAS